MSNNNFYVRENERDNFMYKKQRHHFQRVFEDVHLITAEESDFTGSWGEE